MLGGGEGSVVLVRTEVEFDLLAVAAVSRIAVRAIRLAHGLLAVRTIARAQVLTPVDRPLQACRRWIEVALRANVHSEPPPFAARVA